MNLLRSSLARAGTAPLVVLAMLVVADVVCAAIFVVHALTPGPRLPHLTLSDDHGWAEFYLHLKQLWLVVLLLAAWWLRRVPVLAAWLAVAVFCLADDVWHLHEGVGRAVAARSGTAEILGLGVNHIGEMAWLAVWGIGLGAVVLAAHRAATPAWRRVSSTFAVFFAVLVFFGVVVDVLHVLVEEISMVNGTFVVLEEGGEHVATSLLVATAFAVVLAATSVRAGAAARP